MSHNGNIIKNIGILVLTTLLLGNIVSAVLMDPSVDYMAADWTLNSRSSIDVDYINLSSSWINLGNYGNITFVDNISSTQSIIELFGNYGLGYYSTNLSCDVYAPVDWSVTGSFMPVTNNSENTSTLSFTSYTQINSTHRRYYRWYNPSNTLSQADMGYFDVNVSVTAYNATLQYTGWNVSEDVFEVYMLNPVTEISSGYNSTYHSVNFSWGATEESVFYFDGYAVGTAWASNPGNMVDGSVSTRASSTSDPETQLCTSNTCTGSESGNISTVYVRALTEMWSSWDAKTVTLRPVWNGTDDMDNHVINIPKAKTWSSWYDITNDTNAPTTWNWTNINNLDMDVVGNSPSGGGIYCYQVELKVIYDTTLTNSSADRFVVVRNNNSYPSDPSDGYEVQNSTSTTYDVALTFDNAYFMVFAYNATTFSYSEGTRMSWGCLGVSVYNESAAHQSIGFDIEISDKDGDAAYKLLDQTNTLYVNFSNIPYGDDTVIVISNSSYRSRTYTYDLAVCTFYNYSFYLPPITTPGAGGGSGDSNDSILCLISVVDKNEQPVDNANVTIKRYINTTDNYENIGRILTDGNGQISIWLVPNQLYLFDITKNGYVQEGSKHWIPTELLYTKTFMLGYEEVEYDDETSITEVITFEGWVWTSNNTLIVNYSDISGNTLDTYIVIYQYNHTTNNYTDVVLTDRRYGDNSFSLTATVNTSHTYYGYIEINHSDYNSISLMWIDEHPTAPGATSVTGITTDVTFNTMLNNVIGTNPLGWSNIFGLFIVLGCLFAFGQRNAGIGLIVGGFVVLFINYIVGLDIFVSAIPIFYVVSGVLVQWNNHQKEAAG